jgi:hypothetical protein
MESEMDLQLMLLPAVVTGDPSANNNNNNNNTNNKMVVNCRDEEAEYLERLLTEKKIVDSTAGLDLTQKLINAGKLILVPTDSYNNNNPHPYKAKQSCSKGIIPFQIEK